jgi:hypothetical protein
MEIDDPFVYPDNPDWLILKKRELRRQYMERYLGRPIGKHGGYRPGAGRKKYKKFTHEVKVNLNNIQVMLLEEMGGIEVGIQKLIEEHL